MGIVLSMTTVYTFRPNLSQRIIVHLTSNFHQLSLRVCNVAPDTCTFAFMDIKYPRRILAIGSPNSGVLKAIEGMLTDAIRSLE